MKLEENIHSHGEQGSLDIRRLGAVLGGGVLAIYGLSRRSPLGYALAASGGTLALVGARTKGRHRQSPVAFSTVLLNCSPEEAYRFWKNFENLPRFMHHLESVKITGDRRSRWTAIGPLGKQLSWDAETTEDRENELIAWRSLPGSDVDVHGKVEFRKAPGDRGAFIEAEVHYSPPAGQLGSALSKLFGKDPKFLITQDLRRLKALIEAGEIPTTEGQSHGPRSAIGRAAKVIDPDRPVQHEARVGEVLTGTRRVS